MKMNRIFILCLAFLFMICGSVSAVNEALVDEPELLSESPEERGWICKLVDFDASELDDMMTEDEYFKHLDELE